MDFGAVELTKLSHMWTEILLKKNQQRNRNHEIKVFLLDMTTVLL